MPRMMSGDALVTDEYWAITGDTGQGTLMTFSPDPRKNEVAAPVVAEFQAAGLRPRGLHPLHLRRDPGLGAGGREGRLDRPRCGRRGAARQPVRDRARHHRVRRQGRRAGRDLRDVRVGQRQVRRDRQLIGSPHVTVRTGPPGPVLVLGTGAAATPACRIEHPENWLRSPQIRHVLGTGATTA